MIIKLLVGILLFCSTLGISNLVLIKRGFTYTKKPWLSMFLFSGSSIIAYVVFKKEVSDFIINTNWLILAIYMLSLFVIYFLLNSFTEDQGNIKKAEFTHIKYLYLISKSVEIFFQDILIIIMLYFFRIYITDSLYFVLGFTLFFGLIHAPILLVWKARVARILVLISFTLSCIFPLLFLWPSFNFAYLFCTHWLFYIVGGIAYRTVSSFRNLIQNKQS